MTLNTAIEFAPVTISLSNNKIGFKARANKFRIFLFLVLSCLITFTLIWSWLRAAFPDYNKFIGPSLATSLPLSLLLTFMFTSVSKYKEESFFYLKTDKYGKVREDKVQEFWEKVLGTQDEILLEKSFTEIEKYAVDRFPIEILETKSSVKIIWREIVLFEKSSDGDSSRLEGMPSILFLRD